MFRVELLRKTPRIGSWLLLDRLSNDRARGRRMGWYHVRGSRGKDRAHWESFTVTHGVKSRQRIITFPP